MVLEEHQRLLRAAFAVHGGEEVDTQGDAFFYVFERAYDAAAAAAEGQRAWPPTVGPRTPSFAYGWDCIPASRTSRTRAGTTV